MAEPDLPGVVLNQEYRVKLGKSFTFPKENAFHTIKYDFKPLSVDLNQPGKLRVGEGDEVNMSLPVVQAESADDVVQFRGPKRPCTRECMLIINMDTGEAILEKIGSSVNLKSLRDGRTKAPRDRSISPAPFLSKNPAAAKMSHSGKSSTAHDRKMHKMHPKSRTKTPKATDQSSSATTSGATSLTVPGASVKPSQGNSNSPKVKKSQKKQPKNANALDVQVGPSLTAPPPKMPAFPPPGMNEANPVPQPVSLPTELAQQTGQRLEDSSGSSSGSSSSSSAGSSDSESEAEPHALHVTSGGFAAGGNSGGPTAAPEVPSLQPPQPVRGSMPVLGSGGISIPPFPIQSAPAGDSSSSSASDSESSSDSSSSGSSSDSSDSEMKNVERAPVVSAPQQVARSYSTLEDELSCSSDSD